MSNIPQNFTWRDENGDKLECSEKLRLLQENETELMQMTQDIFEDGLAMGVSKENMNEAMKRLLLHLATSFSLLTFFLSGYATAQTPDAPPATAQAPQQPATAVPVAATPVPESTTPTLPMRATPETPPTLLPAPLLYPANSWEGRSVGVIRILDRVTSETKELEIPVGTTITFHRLTLQLYACNQKPAGLPADAAIRLGLSEIPLKTADEAEPPLQRQFEGWFLAAEPAANIYPSPLYNIQAVRCAGDPAPPSLPPLVAVQQPTNTHQVIADAPALAAEPAAQSTMTPGTPPPENLSLPANTAPSPVPAPVPAVTPSLPFSAPNPSEEKSKKKKHKHHKHEKTQDTDTALLENHLEQVETASPSNGTPSP